MRSLAKLAHSGRAALQKLYRGSCSEDNGASHGVRGLDAAMQGRLKLCGLSLSQLVFLRAITRAESKTRHCQHLNALLGQVVLQLQASNKCLFAKNASATQENQCLRLNCGSLQANNQHLQAQCVLLSLALRNTRNECDVIRATALEAEVKIAKMWADREQQLQTELQQCNHDLVEARRQLDSVMADMQAAKKMWATDMEKLQNMSQEIECFKVKMACLDEDNQRLSCKCDDIQLRAQEAEVSNASVWAEERQKLTGQLERLQTELAATQQQREEALLEAKTAKDLRAKETGNYLNMRKLQADATLKLRHELVVKDRQLLSQQQGVSKEQQVLEALIAKARLVRSSLQLDVDQVKPPCGSDDGGKNISYRTSATPFSSNNASSVGAILSIGSTTGLSLISSTASTHNGVISPPTFAFTGVLQAPIPTTTGPHDLTRTSKTSCSNDDGGKNILHETPTTDATPFNSSNSSSVAAVLSLGSTMGSRLVYSTASTTSGIIPPHTTASPGMLTAPTTTGKYDLTHIYRTGWSDKRQPGISARISSLGVE